MDSSAAVSESLGAKTYTGKPENTSREGSILKASKFGIKLQRHFGILADTKRHDHLQIIHIFILYDKRGEGKGITCGNYLTTNPLPYLYGAACRVVLLGSWDCHFKPVIKSKKKNPLTDT